MATNDLSKAGHNFTCFAKVCVDLMKLPLIDVLKFFIKPQDLHTNIQNSSLTTGKNKLRQDQLKICFIPPPGKPNYNDFDVTLLYTLTRNLCPLLTPTQGWGIEPRTTDTLIGDDIERLRLFRNNYYGHADSTEISDVEFEDLWKDVKSTIRRIDETDISIKGENEVICGKIARFLVDVNPAERPNSLVTWQKVRGRVIEQIDTSREKYRGSYDRQLVINSVCKEDEGEYQAVLSQLSNGMKKTFSNLIFLFPLGEPPCFDVWKVTTSSEEIAINYSYVVPESSPKVQKIQWSRDGTILNLKNTKYDGGGLTDSSLTIMSPNEEDKGNYSCTVSNAVGSVTNNLMFDVPKAKLKLSTEFSRDEVFFGSKVILNSEVSSCPSLDGVKWQASIDAENFTCIDIGEQRYVGSQDNPECPLLVIPKITFEDIFYYRLLVWNKIGKGASNSLRLNVTGSPPNVLTNHEIYIEDQSVRMIGKVFVNKMLPAIKTIYWTKDGKKLEMEDGGEKYSEVNTRNPSLTIRNVNQHDAGTYRLTATNAVGTTSSEIVLDLPSICVERGENPDGSQSYTAMIDSVPAAYRAQWNVKYTDNDTFTPIDVNAEVYKGTSNSLPCPVLVVKQKKLSENKCFQIEVYNFVGRSITKISGNVSLAVLDTQRTAEGDISSYVFNTNGSTVRFNDLRRNLIKGLRSTDLQELKDSLEGLTRERKLFRNVKTISEFFRQLLDEGIFKERDVVILQYLMRAINRPDLEEMCIEYARKDHQALCYFEDPKVREKPKVYLHVVDDMEKYRSLDSLLQTVACIIGCTSKDIEIVGVRPDSSFIIIVALRMDLLNILKDASPLNLTKLVRYNVDWIQIEDKIVNINYPISKAV